MRYALLLSLWLGCSQEANAALAQRFDNLSCAIVRIKTPQTTGTGVFISADGDILTAAHVILDRSYVSEPGAAAPTPKVSMKKEASITQQDGSVTMLPEQSLNEDDIFNSQKDLAVVEGRTKTKCFLKIGDASKLRIGEHLLALGYPASSPSAVLYEGFLSAKSSELHTLGPIVNDPNKVAQSTFDVQRVQMPITPGVSGAPLIADDDTIVGVVIEVPVAVVPDIEKLIQTESARPHLGVLINGFDTNKVLAELAFIVKEFESPGSGFGVPVSYLRYHTQSP